MNTRPVTGPHRPLTPRQQAILKFLATWEAGASGYHPPTVRQIMNGAGLQSTSVVWENLWALQRKGCITLERKLTRTARLTAKGKEAST